MKKIIITNLLMLVILTACQSKNNQAIYKKELKNDESTAIITQQPEISTDTEEKTVETPAPIINNDNPNIQESTNQAITPQSTIEQSNQTPVDPVDENSIDYPIHKGRIDCETEAKCMDKSIPLQFKYKALITNVFYLEVISQKENVLGYFIQYNFKENTYSTKEECETIGSNIKEELNDKITSYECSDNNTLKINSNY